LCPRTHGPGRKSPPSWTGRPPSSCPISISTLPANAISFDKAGRFDTRYIRNALYEEVDFCLRMKKAGFRVFYHPPAEVTHFRAESGGCRKITGSDYLFIKFYNTGFFFFKNLLTLLPLAFFKAMKDEIEFHSREKGGHAWRRAFYLLLGLVLGCARGALAALTGPLRNRKA